MHPAEKYARDVVRGKIITCRWVKLACKRHLDDLKHAADRGLYFDRSAAQRVLDFFKVLKHSKGREWAGEELRLEPWQQFITWSMFGWKRADDPRWIDTLADGRTQSTIGTRRFRTAYIEVARKNGKSVWASGLGLYLAFADQEPGADTYSAATKREQARITHGEAVKMVKASPILRKYIKVYKDNLHREDTTSKYEPLGADADTMDGLNVHGAIVDELHAHKTRDTWDKLETATGSRSQPMIVAITTAGNDRKTVCWEKHEYTERVLSGVQQDDSWFGIIYTLDEKDEWTNEKVWIKANPNLGVSKKWEDMRAKSRRAREMHASLNAFLQLELNIWVHGVSKWMNMQAWQACSGEIPALDLYDHLKGRSCTGGLDLSSTQDVTAFVMFFPATEEGEPDYILCRFWVPEDGMHQRTRDDGVMYETWVREGFMEATPGNTVDYDFIFEQIEQDAKDYKITEVAFDRWGAARVVNVLQNKGMTMVEFGQGFSSMNPPMKELERMILSGNLAHGDHPVLTWMADNLVAKMDPAGNIKPDKEKSREKIDGVVAMIMALDRGLREENRRSIYETRGVIVL